MQSYLLKFEILRGIENDNKIIFVIIVSSSFVSNIIQSGPTNCSELIQDGSEHL